MTARTFQRPGYTALDLYSGSTQQDCALDLSDNTNLWGPAPSAVTAMQRVNSGIARYPSSYSSALVQALSNYLCVPSECIVTGCGSDDILDSAIRAFAEPADVVAMCDPTFSMVPVFTALNGAVPKKIPFLNSGQPDVESLLSCDASVIYLCSPNNPTGSVISSESIEEILDRFDGIVILDEAYAEFSDAGFTSRARAADNLVVTRTMSKAFGLAGIRVGYSISNPLLASEISKSRGPYKISVASEAAAVSALQNDVDWMRSAVAAAQANRKTLERKLATLGFEALPSQANFLLIPVSNAADVGETLAQNGVAVRAFRNLPGIGDAIRVTVGPSEMMERFMEAFEMAVA